MDFGNLFYILASGQLKFEFSLQDILKMKVDGYQMQDDSVFKWANDHDQAVHFNIKVELRLRFSSIWCLII